MSDRNARCENSGDGAILCCRQLDCPFNIGGFQPIPVENIFDMNVGKDARMLLAVVGGDIDFKMREGGPFLLQNGDDIRGRTSGQSHQNEFLGSRGGVASAEFG